MSGEDFTASRVRRMLPSVSEVLRELTARAPIEPEIAFRAAREVCAEELKRIRDAGGESIPLEDLVQRAFLRATGASLNIPAASPLPPPPVITLPPAPPEPVAAAPVPDGSQDVDDPFSETTGALDLRWDRDAREPFSEPVVPDDTLGREVPEKIEVPEEAPPISLPAEPEPDEEEDAERPVAFARDSEDVPGFVLPDPEPEQESERLPVLEPVLQIPDGPAPESGADEGPGSETLTRLSREAQALDLNAAFPKLSEPSAVPITLSWVEEDERQSESLVPVPFEDDEDTVLTIPHEGRFGRAEGGRGPRVGLVLGTVAALVALAGLGYLLAGLWVERDAMPPPLVVSRPRVAASPVAGVPPPATAEPVDPPAPVDAQEKGSVPAEPVLAASSPSPVSTVAPTAVPVSAAPAVPATAQDPAPAPAPVSIAPVPPVPTAGAVRQSRDGLVVTKDRSGLPEVFSIHFTSYKDRASAVRDLKRIQGIVGREGYVAEVDLGGKGVWQRVMIGTFATAQDAKAAREELAAKGTRDMGWVYRVVGPEGP